MGIVTSKFSKELRAILQEKKTVSKLVEIVSNDSQEIVKVKNKSYQVEVLNAVNKEAELSDAEIIRDIQITGYSIKEENRNYFSKVSDYIKKFF